LESAFAAWFMQICASFVSRDGSFIRQKALQIAASLGVDSFTVSDDWINRFKWRHNTVAGESRVVDSETVDDLKK
jgi:hypothetical protein